MRALPRIITAAVAGGLAVSHLAPVAMAEDIDVAAAGTAPIAGLAWDPAHKELFVLSGDDITVLAPSGARLGALTHGADLRSPQGLAFRDGYLYVGDVGDEAGSREYVTIYRVPADPGQQSYRAWDLAYPDGPRNAAAFLISGRGRFFVVTDGQDPGVYRAELEPSRTTVNVLERVADAPAGVTDGVFLTDGTTMALRTAHGVQLLDALSWEPGPTTTYAAAPPDEALTTYTQGRLLVGGPSGLRDEAVPSRDTTVTPAVGTPSPTPTVSGSPSPQPSSAVSDPPAEADPPASAGVSRQGTFMAIGAAVVVALLAGALVFLVRD